MPLCCLCCYHKVMVLTQHIITTRYSGIITNIFMLSPEAMSLSQIISCYHKIVITCTNVLTTMYCVIVTNTIVLLCHCHTDTMVFLQDPASLAQILWCYYNILYHYFLCYHVTTRYCVIITDTMVLRQECYYY